MAGHEYTNALADVAAAYPTAVFSPREQRDSSTTYSLSETVTAPALRDGASKWQTEQQISEGTLTITLGGVAQELVALGTVLSAGQVGVTYQRGVLEFPAAQVGSSYAVAYTGLGSRVTSDLLNRIQLEIAATQVAVDSGGGGSGSVLAQTAAIYVSKAGNDLAAGTSVNTPKLTIGAAITAASPPLSA
jgi:hypothetical protein